MSKKRTGRRAPVITGIGLAGCFLLGLVFVFFGFRAQNQVADAGLGSDDSYQAIYTLSKDIRDAWDTASADLDALTEEERQTVDETVAGLLQDNWEATRTGAGEDAAAFAGGDREITWKLMTVSSLMNGPKVPASLRKKITGLKENDRAAFRLQLLRLLSGGNDTQTEAADGLSGGNDAQTETAGGLSGGDGLALPEAAEALEGLADGEREAMALQLYLTGLFDGESQVTEHVRDLKKSVRNKDALWIAFKRIAGGKTSWLWQLIVSNSKTVILFGILLMLDVLLLALLMASEKQRTLNAKWVIIVLIADFLLVFLVLPVFYMVFRGFFPNGTFSLETVRRLFGYSLNRDALKNTLIAAFATMVLGTAIAFPLAWLVGRTNLYGKKFFRSLFVMTYMVPPYVGAMAWLRLLNPNAGILNQWLRALPGIGDGPGPLNIYTLPGMIWVLTTFYYPYAFITISRAMEKMDPSLEEAGRISGASPLKTILTVTLPMMTPSLIGGALLVFIAAASCYGIPSIIGAQGNVNTITTRIVEYVSLGQDSLNDAIGLAGFLMIVALVILFISDGILARKEYITVSGKSVQPATVDLRKGRLPLTILVALFAAVVVVIPFAVILTTSFKADLGKSMFDPANFTTSNWVSVFTMNETLSSLKNSLIFAAVTATAGLLIACVTGWLLQRTKVRGRSIPSFLIALGSGTPSVVIALSLIMTMRGNFGINIYNTAWILIIAYLIKYMMMGMRTVVSAMSQIHVSLEESSQISGAGWGRTMLKVTGPLILPSIAAGWFLIFIPSFYELSMTALLYSSTTKTVGYQLYEFWSYTSQPMSCALAFGILLIVIVLNFVLNRLTRGHFSI